MIIHIVGPNRCYELEIRDNYDPATSVTLAKEVSVGRLTRPLTKAQLTSIICQTPIDNRIESYNCQTWVGDALERLVTTGYLAQKDCDDGVYRMIDVTMERRWSQSHNKSQRRCHRTMAWWYASSTLYS
jgi:hypothetical protein